MISRIRSCTSLLAVLFATTWVSAQGAGEVAIYTGTTQWIAKDLADEQAQIAIDKLTALGITHNLFASDLDMDALATWVTDATDNGMTDVLVLYGDLPPTLYPDANAMPEGSVAELFIESTDGDAIINHADYMFWGLNARNGEGGLQNMMDIPGIVMWDDNTPVEVTPEGRDIAPTLTAAPSFTTDRPFHLDQLANEWFAEVILAQNAAGTRADPVIVRDGDRGRLIPIFQSVDQPDPKGLVSAEIIAHLFGVALPTAPTQLALTGATAALANNSVALTVQLQDSTGSPRPKATPTTVTLATDSATGAFDTDPNGPFNGSVTSVVVPPDSPNAVVYYRDTGVGPHVVTASSAGLTQATLTIKTFNITKAPPGEVAIYTGTTQWVAKDIADQQAQIAVEKLDSVSIPNTWFQTEADMEALAAWVETATNNGQLDVLVLYGDFPPTLYPQGNTMPDGSIAELFIESTDGDAIMNHADYMFWGLAARNSEGGLRNMMDISGITMWDDNTPVVATEIGKTIAPTLHALPAFTSDRPFHLNELMNDWFAEVILAQNAAGTRADPVIVRDGDRGRLIPVFQSADNPDPKGAVSSEIITWLMGQTLPPASELVLTGQAFGTTGTPMKFRIALQDLGSPRPSSTPVTVNITSDSTTAAFDTQWSGAFDGSVTSVTVPAGQVFATFYMKESEEKVVNVSINAAGLTGTSAQTSVLEPVAVEEGEVVIYTGTTQWIDKIPADEQAQITVNALDAAGIDNTWFTSDQDMQAVADWIATSTNNGRLDVLVLYGDLPPTIYPDGNVMVDDSPVELFIESTDGDAVINHADWMFWGLNARNGEGGLQNIMDVPGIVMWDDDTPVTVTDAGAAISPTLGGLGSYTIDRPFHLDQLANEWFAEVILAENANGTRSDPTIVRDGIRGRLIPVFQAAFQNDPKGAVAAEIIIWLMSQTGGPTPGPLFHRGDADNNGQVQLTDAVRVLNFLFQGTGVIVCADAADSDDNGVIQLTDAVRILNYLFQGTGVIPPPGPTTEPCGADPTPDDLDCAEYSSC